MNDFIFYKDYAEIILYDKHGNEKARTKIDLDDVDKVKDYKWHLSNEYSRSEIDGK